MASRRRARGIALQVLYELDCTSHKSEEVLARLAYDDTVDEDAFAFVTSLVEGVQTYRKQIDSIIEEHARAFPVDQMAPIDRTVLRIGVYELVFAREVPVKVSINEAVELAKTFGGDATPRLVNGVLGSVVAEDRQQRPTEEDTAHRPPSRDDHA
ncbi:MAG: transcription antitermination factor NusB [Dehalococcoidia bacterium]|jgi:N utilization substance protein B|nr:transcription antitermination factor NusB [Dehalococcoidia bacterium]